MRNKKLLLGLTVLATPFVVENIVEENVASANQTVAAATQKQTTNQQVAKSSEYVLAKPAKAYVTANDAAKRVNQKATYKAGSYYVYNQSKGMVNISKASGKAGSWINPVDSPNAKVATRPTSQTKSESSNKVVTAPKANNLSVVPPKAGQHTLLKSTPAYVNANDASKKVNAKGTVSAGNYYIFREYKGMLNVSRAQGKVGSWINPTATIITNQNPTTTPTKPEQTKPEPTTNTQTVGNKTNAGLYALTNATEAYMNAIDASKKTNARGKVSAGNYHIFREYKGMLNISRAQGKPGSWINPGVVTTTPAPATETKPAPATETKPTTPTKPTTENTTQTVGTKTAAGLYALASATPAYMNVTDASRKVNAVGKVSAGNYHIFREYKGMLNISRAQGKPGSWINPGTVVATPAPETKPTPETKTETVGTKTASGTFTLTSTTPAYMNAIDASKKVNAAGKVSAGSYYIFREYKGMLNISKAKGKVGSWINPDSKTTATKLPETGSVTKEVSGKGVTYYTQDNSVWGSKRYGISNMKHAGCVPTSLAMVISTLGPKKVSPVTIADYLYNKTTTFNRKYEGTTSDGIPKVLNQYGLNYKVLNSKSALQSELGKGNMVLSLVQGANFVTPGYTHAVVAKGLDNLGKTTVYNPLTKWGIKKFTTDTLWKNQSTDKIDRTLGGTFISIFK